MVKGSGKDSGKIRNIDVLASKNLFSWANFDSRVRPNLNLILECKQSDLPYIFFISPENPRGGNVPYICGLNSDTITITTDDDLSTHTMPIQNAINLLEHDFIRNTIPCVTMSKCVRRNKGVQLSGSEAFNNLIHPIIKSIEYFRKISAPPSTYAYFNCHLLQGIGVLNAPMLGSRNSGEKIKLFKTPWVRLYRHITEDDDIPFIPEKMIAIDIVHKSYFNTYLNNFLIPYAEYFSNQVIKHADILASNKAFVKGMGEYWWDNIEDRLESSDRAKNYRLKKTKILFSNIMKYVFKENR